MEEKNEFDIVEKPAHYNQGRFETIEIIEDILGDSFPAYLKGNIIKYISREEYKNKVEDLKKARWYLNRLIEWKENKETADKINGVERIL
jgi:hypothetical protein